MGPRGASVVFLGVLVAFSVGCSRASMRKRCTFLGVVGSLECVGQCRFFRVLVVARQDTSANLRIPPGLWAYTRKVISSASGSSRTMEVPAVPTGTTFEEV